MFRILYSKDFFARLDRVFFLYSEYSFRLDSTSPGGSKKYRDVFFERRQGESLEYSMKTINKNFRI